MYILVLDTRVGTSCLKKNLALRRKAKHVYYTIIIIILLHQIGDKRMLQETRDRSYVNTLQRLNPKPLWEESYVNTVQRLNPKPLWEESYVNTVQRLNPKPLWEESYVNTLQRLNPKPLWEESYVNTLQRLNPKPLWGGDQALWIFCYWICKWKVHP